jgi:hypothetical protein
MILLSSLMLLVAGVTVVACVTAIACIQTMAGILAVAVIPKIPDGVTNGVVSVSAVPFEHAVAGGPAVTGFFCC